MMEYLEILREEHGTNMLVVYCALFIGLLFGVVAEISQFCTRAAVAEWAGGPGKNQAGGEKGYDRTLAVIAAVVVAVVGTTLLSMTGQIDLSQTIYWATTIKPVALVAGGVLFGIGMVLAGGCISRLLVLAASGNVRSWITLLVAAFSAYATLRGILSYPRIWLEGIFDTGISTAALYEGGNWSAIVAVSVLILAVLSFALIARKGSLNRAALAGGAGLLVGALVVGGWIATGIVGADDFEPTPLTSLSFVAPIGESLQYLMIFTGDTIRFSIALIGGVLVGALVSSVVNGRFQFVGFQDEPSILRYVAGGVLMGFGGVTALGCTVGQGLSGISTASPASIIALIAIIGGAYGTMKFRSRNATELVVPTT